MNLLIIEDKDIDLLFVKKTLQMSGEPISIDNAKTIKDGLELLGKQNYECILLDLHLPDANKYDAFNKVFDVYSNIPIVLLTGSDDDFLALDLIDKGAQDYIIKEDINSRDLLKAIKFAIRRIKTENQLRELNATKDKFFSIMAHDLKNPLSIFALATDTLSKEMDYLEKEDLKQYLIDLNENAQNIYKLLENLLTWSRTQRGKIGFEPDLIEIGFLINGNIELYKKAANEKNINLTANFESGVKAYTDSNLINTIIRNLINNAIKYTKDNGNVEVKLISTPKTLDIVVSDDGVGMGELSVENLFKIDVNISTPGTKNEKGTGLGLIVCKEFAELLGGEIRCESVLGQGTKFILTIPRAIQ